jgi:hypothetical protein
MTCQAHQAARGSKLPHAKLTERAVRAIRRNRHGWTIKQTAMIYGVHWRTVDDIRADRKWTHPEAYP